MPRFRFVFMIALLAPTSNVAPIASAVCGLRYSEPRGAEKRLALRWWQRLSRKLDGAKLISFSQSFWMDPVAVSTVDVAVGKDCQLSKVAQHFPGVSFRHKKAGGNRLDCQLPAKMLVKFMLFCKSNQCLGGFSHSQKQYSTGPFRTILLAT